MGDGGEIRLLYGDGHWHWYCKCERHNLEKDVVAPARPGVVSAFFFFHHGGASPLTAALLDARSRICFSGHGCATKQQLVSR
jgi:hypothetical protein